MQDSLQQLGTDSLLLGARNLALAAELKSLLRTFRDRDIRCAPLRGIALAERLHRGFGDRPMGDIDLLVRHRDLPAVRALHEDHGYREIDRRPGFSDSFSNTLKFFREDDFQIIVEPHWTIAYPPFLEAIDMDAVWGRCVDACVLREPAMSLASEDLLMHLALHVAHRDSAPRLWYEELEALLRQEADTIDWDLVVSICDQSGIGRLVARVLSERASELSESALEVSVGLHESVIERLAGIDSGRRRSLARRLAESSQVREREGVAQFFALRGVRQRLRYLRMLLFPTAEFMMLEYDVESRGHLVPAYLARFFRFGWEGLRGVAQLLAKPEPNNR